MISFIERKVASEAISNQLSLLLRTKIANKEQSRRISGTTLWSAGIQHHIEILDGTEPHLNREERQGREGTRKGKKQQKDGNLSGGRGAACPASLWLEFACS